MITTYYNPVEHMGYTMIYPVIGSDPPAMSCNPSGLLHRVSKATGRLSTLPEAIGPHAPQHHGTSRSELDSCWLF